MTQEPSGKAPDWGPLLSAPLEVIKRLKDEPLLLVGMGVAVLLAIIAIFAPDRGRLYALLLTGFVLLLCLLRAVTLGARVRRRDDPAPGGRSEIKVGGNSDVEDVDVETQGMSAHTSVIGGRKTRLKGVTIRTGQAARRDENPPTDQKNDREP